MKPNGFVLAAATTSQMSTPIGSRISFISFTSAMFTARKMFSSSLADSATSADSTATTSSTARLYAMHASSVDLSHVPPTSLGIVRVEWLLRPGSSRSGLKATKTSRPIFSSLAFAPAASSIAGMNSSRVVPG